MKRKYIVFILLFFLFSGCGLSLKGIKEVLIKPKAGAELFDSAENNYAKGNYDAALKKYSTFIHSYPASEFIPAALLKIGMIEARKKEYDKAEAAFKRLIEHYSESIFANQARVQLLKLNYDRGRFEWVFEKADTAAYKNLPRPLLFEAELVTGDAAMALNLPLDAYSAFLSAYIHAPVSAKKTVAKHLMSVLSIMSYDQIEACIKDLNGRPPVGYLMYRQGLNDLADGRISKGLARLKDFVSRFPDHEYAARAEKEISDLMQVTYFKGHVIGCLFPLSGRFGVIGKKALRGAELAVSEFGRDHATDSPPGIIVYDSAGDPETARKAINELSEKGVAAVIGPMVTAGEAADAASARQLPIIVFTQKPGIAEKGDMVFRNFLTPEMQVEGEVYYTSEILGLKRYAILYPDEPYGKKYMNLFWDAVIRHGGKIVGAESYMPSHTDFSKPIKKLVGLYYNIPNNLKKSPVQDFEIQDFLMNETDAAEIFSARINRLVNDIAEPKAPTGWETDEYRGMTDERSENKNKPVIDFDAVFIPDGPKKAGLIIPQLRYYDINDVYLLGTNLWHSRDLIKIAGYQIKKVVIPEGFFAESRRKNVVQFVSAFKKAFGYTPGFIEAVSYDSAMLLFRLLSRPEISYRTALRAAMVNMPEFDGVTGRTLFDENGDAKKTIYLLKVRKSNFMEIAFPQLPIGQEISGQVIAPRQSISMENKVTAGP